MSAAIATVRPYPTTWEVACPVCGEPVECNMRERDDGKTWESGDHFGDPFVTCECGATIEPTPVIVTTRQI